MTLSRTRPAVAAATWPALPHRSWSDTLATLNLWAQIVGKIRLATAAPLNHWWHIALRPTPRGLTTGATPWGAHAFQIDFDFVGHRLVVSDDGGRAVVIELAPMTVADFYREVMAALSTLGIDVRIHRRPVEMVEAIPFDEDTVHRTYDRGHVEAFWRATLQAERVFADFRTGFIGKASPVHFFWGSFDLAVSRYSGRRAPLHPGGTPNCPDWVMHEAYSHEDSSVGWWPLGRDPGPLFYAYHYPEPRGYRDARVAPDAATFHERLGEFVVAYDAIAAAPDPDRALLAFAQSTYEAGARLAGWNRAELEPSSWPIERPPRRAWSTAPPER